MQIVRALEGYMNIKDIWDEKNDNKFLSGTTYEYTFLMEFNILYILP